MSDPRYHRQTLLPQIGEAGQQRLGSSRVLLIGCGALGTTIADQLTRAGVGHLTIVDRDIVELTNLQRQTLFDESDAASELPKAIAAANRLRAINSSVEISPIVADVHSGNLEDLIKPGVDLLLDGTDNVQTRYLINDVCVRDGRPWIYAAAVGAYAATMNILPRAANIDATYQPTACLACLFPASPTGNVETCDTAGILSTAVNFAASLQATETLKLLTGQPDRMRRTLLAYDLWTGERSEVAAGTPRADCEVCDRRSFRALAGEGRAPITLCGRNAVQIHEHARPVDLAALARRLEPLGEVRANGLLLRFRTPPHTITVFPDGRALIQGTTDVGRARSLYARYIGA